MRAKLTKDELPGAPDQGQRPDDLTYERDSQVDPLALIGNAALALHHHMAPADGSFDFGDDEALDG